MHKALQCPEILSEIFDNLVTRNGLQSRLPQRMSANTESGASYISLSSNRELETFPESLKLKKTAYLDKRSCLAAGMTCKAFLQPALNIVWRDMSDLAPIMKLLPDLKRMPKKEDPNRNDDRYEEVHQPFYIDYVLSIQHLEGIKYYAHRVRTFTFYIEAWYQSPFWDFEPSFLSSLSSLLGQTGHFLFPHLRAVSIIPKTPTRFRFPPYMSLLLSPTLRTVSFPFISPGSKDQLYPNAFWTFMHDLAVYCPQMLRELNASFTLPASVVAAISNFTGLESLVVYSGARSCDLELLHTFSKLPRLQFLSLDLVAFKAPRPPSHVQHPRFFTLTTLQLHADLESSSDFISLVNLSALKMLALKMGLSAFLFSRTLPPSTIDHWEHLFVQVAARLPHLRTFILQGDYPMPALPWRCFAPLLRLQHLLDIRICMPKVECLSKADFTQIVEAWPLLEHLDIETAKVQPDYVDCDYALTMVASNLPHLRVLNVDLNLNGLGASPHGTSGRPIPHSSLRYLLGISGGATVADTALRPRKSVTRSQQNNSPLDLPQTLSMVSRVACFLDSLFPNIQVVPSEHNGSDDVLACVKSYLITLQQARQRESLNASRLGPGFYKA